MSIYEQQVLLKELDFKSPTDYLAFIFSNNLTCEGGNYSYLDNCGDYLYAAVELSQINLNYNAVEFYPGYLLIGSDGGGEAFAIEKTTGYFVRTPFIGHDEDTPIVVGQTWPEFLKYLNDNAA